MSDLTGIIPAIFTLGRESVFFSLPPRTPERRSSPSDAVVARACAELSSLSPAVGAVQCVISRKTPDGDGSMQETPETDGLCGCQRHYLMGQAASGWPPWPAPATELSADGGHLQARSADPAVSRRKHRRPQTKPRSLERRGVGLRFAFSEASCVDVCCLTPARSGRILSDDRKTCQDEPKRKQPSALRWAH